MASQQPDAPFSINRLEWGLASPEHMERCAAVVVTSAAPQVARTLPDAPVDAQPWCGTLADRRMGALGAAGDTCFTCGGGRDACRGHFGVIRLERAVLPAHLAPTVRAALDGVCLASESCAGLPNAKKCPACNAPRHAHIAISKTHVVVRWAPAADRADLELTMDRVARWLRAKPPAVWRALNIPFETAHPAWCVWTRLPVLPITARPYRGMHASGSEKYMPDPTTKAYRIVLLCNQALADARDDAETVRVSRAANLYDAVMQLLVGSAPVRLPGERGSEGEKVLRRVAMLSSRALTTALSGGSKRAASAAEAQRSIASRLSGKTGRVRGHLLRNRCDQALRAVISGTDALDVDEIGVPYDLARQVTKPVRVFSGNLGLVRTLLLEKRDLAPANPRADVELRDSVRSLHVTDRASGRPIRVRRISETRVVLELETPAVGALSVRVPRDVRDPHPRFGKPVEAASSVPEDRGPLVKRATISGREVVVSDSNLAWVAAVLKPGDTVHRTLQDGDVVLFNRQPSLHAGSMMSMRVRIVLSASIWMRDELALSFNADHDGDEMNVFVIQTELAEAEARELCGVQQNIMTTHPGLPNMGVMQNALVGAYLMTDPRVQVGLEDLGDMLVRAGMGPEHVRWDWQLVHLPAQRGAAERRAVWTGRDAFSHLFPPDFEWPGAVEAGRLLPCADRLTKKHLGESTNGFVEHMHKRHGSRAALDFLNRVQPFVAVWLDRRGFTMRRDDLRVSRAETRAAIAEQVRADVAAVDAEARVETAERHASPARMALFWMDRAQAVFRRATETTLRALEQEDPFNSALVMVRCGSKGKEANAVQMTACLGLQTLKGRMIRSSTGRLLPHFAPVAAGAAATLRSVGFVASNFSGGLSLEDALVHARAGRSGVVDTALQAPTAGHLSRKLRDALQEIAVAYDGTVRRTHTGEIVQHAYGGTGFDPEKVWMVSGAQQPQPQPQPRFSPFPPEVRAALSGSEATAATAAGANDTLLVEARSAAARAALALVAREEDAAERVKLVRLLHDALAEPGAPVGMLAALGASHSAMQATMNSFKVAGQMQAGKRELERVWEILRMAQRQPDTLITVFAETQEAAEFAARAMRVRRLSFFVLGVRVLPDGAQPAWEARFEAAYAGVGGGGARTSRNPQKAVLSEWVVQITLSRMRMQRDAVEFRDLVARVRKFAPWARVSHTNLAGHDDAPPTVRMRALASRWTRCTDAYRAARAVCTNTTVSGPPCFRTNAVDVNGLEVRALAVPAEAARALRMTWRIPGLVHARTTCSHIQTVHRVFGIQAARKAVVRELRATIGGDVSAVHIGLLADALTRDGFPRAVHSPADSLSVIATAAYDRQLKRFVSGAVRGASDRVADVPVARAVGARVPLGTGAGFALALDVAALEKHAVHPQPNLQTAQELQLESEPIWPVSDLPDPFSPMAVNALEASQDSYEYGAAEALHAVFSPLQPEHSNDDGAAAAKQEEADEEQSTQYVPSTPNYELPPPPSPEAYSPSTPNYEPAHPAQYSPSSPYYSPTG